MPHVVSRTVILASCVKFEYHMGVTNFEAPTEVRTLVAGEPLHSAPEAKVLPLDHQLCLILSGSGQGSPPQLFII